MLATVSKTVDSPRPMRITHALALLAGAAGGMIPACASHDALAPIAVQHAATLEALHAHTEASRVLLERHVDSAIEIRRIALTGRIHRELLRLGLMTPDSEPVLGKLEELTGDAATSAALVEEIRTGRMTLEQAQAWLTDYALTCKMSEGTNAKRTLLAQLSPIETFETGAQSLRKAVTTHGESISVLIAELRADAQTIDIYANQGALPTTWNRARTRELIEQHILMRIENIDRRNAAAELLDLLLTPLDIGASASKIGDAS